MSKKVFVDAGHSGVGSGLDCGAIGNGLYECNINLSVSKRVEYHLKRHGISVLMSRQDGSKEIGLSDRPRMANDWGADCFVSIHCNSASFTAYGIETFCYDFKYRKLADCIHNRAIANTSLYYANRGVKSADFCVLRESHMDAALIEMAFISNERDSQLLKTKQEEYAIAISKGVLDYLGMAWKDEASTSQPSTNVLYRVKDKSGKQLGAYSVYANAEKMAKDNKALVYDANGKVVADYSIVVTQPTPTPTPVKEKINVTYQVYGTKFYSEVVNLNDYAGVFNVPISCVKAKLSKGTIVYRVSPIGQNYYGWVRNYQYPEGAGIYNKCIDQFEAKLEGLSGYTVRYRVHTLKHGWLPWVQNGEMAGIRGFNIDALQIEVI